jgi:peptidoglycan/LPS O-acetylase OafA/YrhL
VVSNALLLNTDMNNVAWTLRVELEMAVLFPFLYFMNRRLVPLADALVLCGFAVLCAVQPTPDTLKWTFAFYAGLMLPRWGPWITAVARESPVGAGPWVVASLVAFGITRPLCLETSLEWAIPIIETLSGSALLVYVVHIADRRWFMWLDGQMVRQLGRISYSFYVFNFIVLYLLGLLLLATVPAEALATAPFLWNCAMGIAACLSSIPIAVLSYRWIERPSLEIGRRLTRVMGHKGEEKRQEEVDLAKAA